MTRILGDVGIGKYSFAFAITQVFFLFATFGITPLQIREVSKDKTLANRYLINVALVRLLFSTVSFLAVLFLTLFLPYGADMLSALRIFGLALVFNALSVSFVDLFAAFERFEYNSLILVFNNVFTTVVGITVLLKGYGLIGLCWVWLVGWMLTLLFSFILVKTILFRPKWEFDLKFSLWVIKTSWPFALSGMTYFIFFKVDTVILFALKGAEATGWYSVACRVFESLVFLPQYFLLAVYPTLSQLYKQSIASLNEVMEKVFRYLLVISLPFTVGGFFVAKGLVKTLFTSKFDNSSVALKILISGFTLFALREGFIQILNAIERQRVNFYIDSGALIFNIALNLILIPQYSYLGASIATVASYILVTFVSYFFYSKFISGISLRRVAVKPLLCSLILAAFLWLAHSCIEAIPLIAAGGVVYIASLFLFRAVDLKALKIFR